MSKSLSEIIAAVGDDKVQVQILAKDLVRATDGAKGCDITFATERGSALRLDRNEVIGLIVWIKQDDYKRATAEALPESNPEPIRTIYEALPDDVKRKVSLHDLKRIHDALAGYRDLDLLKILETCREGWNDIHEHLQVAKHNLTAAKPMLVHPEGIAKSERVIAKLKTASARIFMCLEGVTNQDIAETKPE